MSGAEQNAASAVAEAPERVRSRRKSERSQPNDSKGGREREEYAEAEVGERKQSRPKKRRLREH